jgi:hypothetical protein
LPIIADSEHSKNSIVEMQDWKCDRVASALDETEFDKDFLEQLVLRLQMLARCSGSLELAAPCVFRELAFPVFVFDNAGKGPVPERRLRWR